MDPALIFQSMDRDAMLNLLGSAVQHMPIMKFYNGQQMTKCIYICAKLRICEKLGNTVQSKKSCYDIATEVGAHGESLYRMMRAMSTEGFFSECIGQGMEKGIFQHTNLSIQLLNQVTRDEALLHCGTAFYLSWESLYETVMTGKTSGFKSLDSTSLWDFLKKNPEADIEFTKGMASMSSPSVQHLVKMGDFSKFEIVCDVGGSHGLLLNEILKNYPTIKQGLNFDQPIVFENLKKLGERQLDPRFSDVGGNFFESVPEADCYVFKWVLHNWNDDQCVEILANVSEAIRTNGKVYLAEHMGEDSAGDFSLKKRYVAWTDLHMMNLLNGKVRNKSEWNQLISRTDFKIDQFVESDQGLTQNFIILSKKSSAR
ncbi:hypothetical protein PPL_04465 [Heterostelium album PN500]|uniref:O-methyltransferase n=1 Tax=Heterostelium pallidum (strain ATCC 26659 / Pp 5 / PN500) TaxID=670386 RepID=D3B7M7_HETP5|nr:hypothetical protein PPL_04465 [Heterostelium album PN500]EFA82770.1 hypothetical protein PPL_04465 [Heterostelium album PN500]|eukprot:XP_020434887.1 hypothetical protein PPL_04465 [Heterostelium album PN500]